MTEFRTMRWQGLVGLFVCALMATMSATTTAGAAEAEGWKITGGSGDAITDGAGYNLFNINEKGFLDGKDRWGANLGWQKSEQKNVEIKRKSGSGPLKCGELFAFKVDKEWVVYGRQNVGINLTTRTKLDDSAYQWKITKCTAGQPVPKDAAISLTNTKENDALVGCKRPAGVNLAWANDVEMRAGYCVRTKRSL